MRVRTTTAMCRAWFRRRSPPRLSRWRTVFPEDAGMGLTPAREANAASERRRPSWDQAAIATAAVTGPIPGLSSSTRAGLRRSRSVVVLVFSASSASKTITRLAKRVIVLEAELAENTKTTTDLLRRSPARVLLDKPGIGPVTAAVAMAAWSHDGRLRSEAAFASLAGVNPIPASSGNTVRHRLNRGGDRRLNQALHMAVVVRTRMDPATKAYVERRLTEGHTKKEIRRCLKRYLARQISHPHRRHSSRRSPRRCDQRYPDPGLTEHRRIVVFAALAVARLLQD